MTNIALLRCEYTDRIASDPEYLARQEDGVRWAAEQVERQWRDLGQDVTVRGWVMAIEKGEEPAKSSYPLAAVRRLKDYDPIFKAFAPDKTVYWGGVDFKACGWGEMGGDEAVVFWDCGHRTAKHEVGHLYGLNHSNGFTRDGNLRRYDDTTCIMGKGTYGLNAWQRQRLGLPVKTQTTGGVVTLVPCEYDPECVGENEYQQVHVGKYALSARRRYPGVFVYDVSDKDEPALVEKIDYNEPYVRDGVSVTVMRATEEWIGPSERPKPGLYHDPRFDGQGLEVYEKDGLTGMVWYTFQDGIELGQKVPSRRFYSGKLDGNVFRLFTTHSGTFGDPGKSEEVRVGSGWFRDGVFLFDIKGYRRGCMRLERLMTGGELYQGRAKGEGLSFYDYEGEPVGFWYTYGPPEKTPMGKVIPNTEQRWYLLRKGVIWEVTGPQFMTGWDFTEKMAGTFVWDGETFRYAFDGVERQFKPTRLM